MTRGEVVDNAKFRHRIEHVSFHCVKCGMIQTTSPRSSSIVASRIVCLQCGQSYWVYWHEEKVKRSDQ